MATLTAVEALELLDEDTAVVKRRIMAKDVQEADADDILQIARIKAARKVDSLKDENKIHAWFSKIADNAMHDFLRRKKREEARFGAMIPLDDANELCYHDDRIESLISDNMLADKIRHASSEAIMYAIRKLPPRERAMFTLFYEDGMTWRDVAASMNLKETTVRTAVHRCKSDFIDYLREYYEKESQL